MINDLRIYMRYIAISIRGQMQYRASFIMETFAQFVNQAIIFIGILVLFSRFNTLEGWSLAEVAFLYGLVNVAFAFADAASLGFDHFGTMVRSGDFDRLLLRPRSTALQLAGQELVLRRIGRLSMGLAALLWASAVLDVDWNAVKVVLILFTIACGACLFFGLVVLQATLAFWTTETLEIMNTVTYGGVETTQFPLSIYRPWFRHFFTFVIPLATVSYFPALAILDKPDTLGSPLWFQYAAPVIGLVFLILCLRVWEFGVRHYLSTGS